MKVLCVLAALIAVIAASDEQLWKTFKQNHAKKYRGVLEEKLRYEIFQSNLKKIEEHNKKHASGETKYTMAINQFADLTHEEFIARLNTHPRPTKSGGLKYNGSSVAAADVIDWRNFGSVTYVKDQGACGSCWSFSTTGAIEGQYQRATGQLVAFSEQALVDCSTGYGNGGCSGGVMQYAYDFVRDNGLPTEDAYPYEAIDDVCRGYDRALQTLSNYVSIGWNDEQGLMNAVSDAGPVSVAVDASNFQFYGGGLFDDLGCSPDSLNHGVLAVGYGNENGQDYWIVKNSWGAGWGEGGYIRMLRWYNQCGIATDATYPIL